MYHSNNMEQHTDVRELVQAVFISGVEARTLLQAAAWLKDLNLQSLYSSPIFGAVCAKNGHEGPVHLMQIDSFAATANKGGLFDPLLSCRDGSSCLNERCSRLLDVVPPGETCEGCTALSGSEWDTALMQLQQRIAIGAAADHWRAVGVHTSIQQVATTMIRLCSLQRCYQLLLPLHQMLAAHGHTISQLQAVVEALQGTSQQQQQQQDAGGSSNRALGLHHGGSAASLRPAAQQALQDTLLHFPQQQYGALLDMLATTLSKLQDLSVDSLRARALNRETEKQQLLDAHNPQATQQQQQQLRIEEDQQPPEQQQECQPQQVLFSAQQQPKLLVRQERQPKASLKRSAADTAVVDSPNKQRRLSNHDSLKGAQQQQAAPSPALASAAAAAAHSQKGLRATPSTAPPEQQQLQPQLHSPFSTAVDRVVAAPATPAVSSSRPEFLTPAAVAPRIPLPPVQQAAISTQPAQGLFSTACSSDMDIDDVEPVKVTAAGSAQAPSEVDEAGGAGAKGMVEEPRAASDVVAIPPVQSSSQTAQVSSSSPTPQVPATPTPKKPQGPGTSGVCIDGSPSRTAVNLLQRLDNVSCSEPMKQSPAAGSTGKKSSVGSKGSAKAAAAVLSTSHNRELQGQPDVWPAIPAADVPKVLGGNTETQQQKQQGQQLGNTTTIPAAAAAANQGANRIGAADSIQAVSGLAAGSQPSAVVTEAPMPAAPATGSKTLAAATAGSKAEPTPVKAEAAPTKLKQTTTAREGSKPAAAAAFTGSKLAAQATAGVKSAKAAAATAGSELPDAAAAGAMVARLKPAAQAIPETKSSEAKATGLKTATTATTLQPATAAAAAAGSKHVGTVAIKPEEGSKPDRLAAAATGSKTADKAAASPSRLATDRLVSAPAAPSRAKRPAVEQSVAASGSALPSPAATAGRADTAAQATAAGDTARHHHGMKGSSVIRSSSGSGRTAIPTPPPPPPRAAAAAAAAGDHIMNTLSSTTEAGRAMEVGRQYHDSNRTEAGKITVAVTIKLHKLLADLEVESIPVSSLITECPELPAAISLSPPAVVGYLMHRSHLFWQDHTVSKQDPHIGLKEFFREVLLSHPWVSQYKLQYRTALQEAARNSEVSGSVGLRFGAAAQPPLLPKELLPIRKLFTSFYHFAKVALAHSDLMIVSHFTSHNIILKNQEYKYAEQCIPQLLCQNHVRRSLPWIADTLVGALQQSAYPGRDLGLPRLRADDAVELIQQDPKFSRLAVHFQVPGFFPALMKDTMLRDTFWWGSYMEPGSSGHANTGSHDGDDQHHVQYIELRRLAAQHRTLELRQCRAWENVVRSGGDVNQCRNGWRCWFCHAPDET